ncbi:18826_t:CDS:2 [Racocetra fulgida]|uniref:18826_t:CDS:1 n=1 Tax=Racocetra fulgida TaxID=60492 RepID=A0A9N9BZL7_9GLOM|nr:18826_t:CDS:2 [Racocetra fulgida]
MEKLAKLMEQIAVSINNRPQEFNNSCCQNGHIAWDCPNQDNPISN